MEKLSAHGVGATTSWSALAAACPFDDVAEFGADFSGDGSEVGVVDQREHPVGVDRGDVGLALGLVDDDVAGEQRAEFGFLAEGAVCEWRVAGAEDQVRLLLDAEFLAQRCLDVDFAEDAEPFGFQLVLDALDSFCERRFGAGAEGVAGREHLHSSSR